MKVMTIGWISVFFIILFMNLYIWSRYWRIPFETGRFLKLSSYLGLHLFLIFLSVYYFYIFFNGRLEEKRARLLGYVASFYISFLHYSMIFYLCFDLMYITRNFIPYSLAFRNFINRLFFGGFLIYALAAILAMISIYNSKRIVIKDYRLSVDKRNSKLDYLNIVYISDGHVGTCVNLSNIDGIVREIKALKPDILLLGGDFFDEGTSNNTKFIVSKKIGGIKTKYGIYAVEGNHEYKSDLGNIDDEMRYFSNVGIRVLQDRSIRVKDRFYLVGRKDKYGSMEELDQLTLDLDENLPVILLDHRPAYGESSKNDKISIQLSGHTHSGQFFPLQIFEVFISSFKKEFIYGHHKVNGVDYIVSSGLGNWGIPARLGSRREIVNLILEFE